PSYPYILNNVVTITGSSAGPDFYYYLYDWEVRGPDCRSDRSPLNITVAEPVFDFTADTVARIVAFDDQSTNANAWFWDFGDGAISNDQNPVHTYTGPGVYPVRLVINGACLKRDTVILPVLANTDNPLASLQISLVPNPAEDQVRLTLNQAVQETLDLTLYSIEGKAMLSKQLNAGSTSSLIDLNGIAAGVYLLQIKGDQVQQTLRLMVNP
ncbi:MAG: PKD domain-containing protein, partial [Bacteroidota bacterium]